MSRLSRADAEGHSRLYLYPEDEEEERDVEVVERERELVDARVRRVQTATLEQYQAFDHFQRSNWDAARIIAGVVTSSLLAEGSCSSRSHESTPEPTPEPSPLVNESLEEPMDVDLHTEPTTEQNEPAAEQTPKTDDPVEEVMGPDLGPEETGTRPMYTSLRGPWVGANVLVIGSHRKGLTGILRSVHIDWSLLDTVIEMSPEADYSKVKSGLLLDVELDVVLAGREAPIERIDYRDVVELKTCQRLNIWRPMDHTHEVWYLRPDLPIPAITPASYLSRFDRLPVANPRTPRPRTPTPPPRSPRFSRHSSDPWSPMGELAPTERDHWILNPKLVGLWIEVTITGGAHDSGGKPVYVKPVSKSRGVVVEYTTGRGLTAVTHTVSHKFIVRSKDPIKPSTENALMVVTTGNEHAGKLVRRIRTFYLGAKEEDYHWVVGGVISKGESGKESLTDELLELHPGFHLVRVRESARQRAEGNKYMDDVRKEARKEWSHRVELHVPVLRTDGCMKSTVVTLSHDKCDGCDVRALAKYRATRRDAFSNSAPQAHKFPLPFLPPFPNASYSHTTIIPFMPANRSPPSRSSRSTGPIRATERQSRRSPEPERSREEPRLTRRQRERQRQLKEAFDKWSSGILEGSTPAQGALQ
ncbi:hypothetical protein PQX77_011261, partial [Marasmius sp. AFHP31]